MCYCIARVVYVVSECLVSNFDWRLYLNCKLDGQSEKQNYSSHTYRWHGSTKKTFEPLK